MDKESIQCIHFYSFKETFLVLSEYVQAILPIQDYEKCSNQGWHLGHVAWDNTLIPVIDLTLNLHAKEVVEHTHMMVLRCLGGTKHASIATLIGQIARPVEIHPNDLDFVAAPKRHLYPVKGPGLVGQILDMGQLTQSLMEGHIIE